MTDHTPGPWVQFADQGKCIAIMPAGREGDICIFAQSPSDSDARLMTLAPALVKALRNLEEANDKLAALRSQEMYLAMLDAGQEFALADLQDARNEAKRVLCAVSTTQGSGK